MSRVVRVFGVKLHPQAACEDCPKQWSSSAATRDVAKVHAKATGHSVVVETISRDVYRAVDQ